MIIIPFEIQYKQQVIELVTTIQQKEFNVPVTAAEQPDLQDIPNYCQTKNGNFWLTLTDDKQVAGTISLLDNSNGIGTIRKMFVKAEFRGKELGIAQKLLNHLWQWGIEKQFKTIYLGTIERLFAARKFYERNGFELIEKSELPAEFPIMAIDTHFYFKKIS